MIEKETTRTENTEVRVARKVGYLDGDTLIGSKDDSIQNRELLKEVAGNSVVFFTLTTTTTTVTEVTVTEEMSALTPLNPDQKDDDYLPLPEPVTEADDPEPVDEYLIRAEKILDALDEGGYPTSHRTALKYAIRQILEDGDSVDKIHRMLIDLRFIAVATLDDYEKTKNIIERVLVDDFLDKVHTNFNQDHVMVAEKECDPDDDDEDDFKFGYPDYYYYGS